MYSLFQIKFEKLNLRKNGKHYSTLITQEDMSYVHVKKLNLKKLYFFHSFFHLQILVFFSWKKTIVFFILVFFSQKKNYSFFLLKIFALLLEEKNYIFFPEKKKLKWKNYSFFFRKKKLKFGEEKK